MTTKRLTASERESLVRLNIALEILHHEPEVLAARAAMVPGVRRDLAMLRAKIQATMGRIVTTVPDEQIRTYLNALHQASFTIGAKRPGKAREDREYGMWLPYEVLNTLLNGLHDHCMLCTLERDGRARCELRKGLDAIPNDVPARADGDCQYYALL